MTYAVEVSGLTKAFGDFTAVDGLSFRVQEGEIFGFLGPNGSGKTTTIRMLCGIMAPTRGRAKVAGYDVVKEPEKVKEQLGYMSQRFSLYSDLTVRENLEFYADIYQVPLSGRPQRVADLIAMANLTGRANELAANLSGGLKQRLALGCAIVHRPAILFLDEPTGGVDPASRRNFWDMIYGLAGEGITVFVTTHYLDEAEHCNTLGLMHNARLIALGTPDELKANYLAGDLLEVDASPAMGALEALSRLPFVKDTALYGLLLHVVVDSADQALPVIEEALRSSGVAVKHIAPISPSLEDVFVSLIDAQDRAQVRQGLRGLESEPR
ncbi:MAG: ABC transporter ATP-binding protein [Chloroflexi bacterium]|nr:ABC transporter ATP-binding protein [Chloroflexota bacterium]